MKKMLLVNPQENHSTELTLCQVYNPEDFKPEEFDPSAVDPTKFGPEEVI